MYNILVLYAFIQNPSINPFVDVYKNYLYILIGNTLISLALAEYHPL